MIARRDARLGLQSGMQLRGVPGRVRVRGLAGLNSVMILRTKSLMSRLMATLSQPRVMLTDVVSAARKASAFRRRFHEPVLRLVARLRNGFALGASLSMANLRFLVSASGPLIMCGLTVA